MKVSVLVMTYNHERFISQALESVLMQKVTFEYEILISEDRSTDDTRNRVLNIHAKYPDRIRLLLSETNLHSNEIVVRGIEASKGQYVALLDGDDYWLCPYKLQKQVDFLETHPECAMCFHNVDVLYEDEDIDPHPFHADEPKSRFSRPVPKPISTLRDLVRGNFIQNCSTFFRRGLFREFPSWYYNFFPITDWPLHILNAQHGHIGYIDEVLGVYRVHRGGQWSMNMSLYRHSKDIIRIIQMYETIDKHLGYRYKKQIEESVLPLYYEVSHLLLAEHNPQDAAHYAKKYLFGLSLRERVRREYLARQVRSLNVVLRSYVPSFNSN